MSKLYLFTGQFPYGKGEAYLETEIRYLAECFKEVLIVPLEEVKGQRELPLNCKVLSSVDSFDKPFTKLMKGLFCLAPFPSGWFREFFKALSFGKSGLWDYFSSFCRARRVYNSKSFKVAKGNADLLYFYWARNAADVLALKPNLASKTIARYHGFDLYLERGNGYIPFQESVLEQLSGATVISDQGTEYLSKKFPHESFKIFCSKLGVSSQGRSKPSADGIFRIVTCSNDAQVKRIPLIAQALGQCEMDNLFWTHLGRGDHSESKGIMKGLGFENFNFLGEVTNQEVYDYYLNEPVDLFLNISSSEGLPVSIMEALSGGIPVIATDVGGTAELVDKNVGELLGVDLNPSDLAKVLDDFSSRHDLDELRNNAFNRWKERVDADKNYNEFSKFLLGLVNEK